MSSTAVTPKIVQVPSIGNVQFPGDMSDDQISAAIKKNYPQLSIPAAQMTPEQMATALRTTHPEMVGKLVQPGVKSGVSMNAPVSSLLTGIAGGAGIPETKTPVRDLAAGIISPPNALEASGAPEHEVPALSAEDQAAIKRAEAEFSALPWYRRILGHPDIPRDVGERMRAPERTKAMVYNAYRNYAPGIPIVSPAIAASANQADKSVQAFKEGRPYEGTVRAAGAAVPIIGPASVEAGTEIGEGIENKDIDQILHGAGSGIGTVGGLLLGTKRGQAAAEKVVSKTLRPTINAVTGAPAVATSKVLGGGEKAMAKAPIKQQAAAGAATNLEVAQYAKSKGIDLLPGQATGSRGLQTLQAVGERAIVAPGELPEVLEKQKAAFGNAVDDFKTRVGTEAIPDTETAGLSLQSQAHHGLDTLRKAAQADYAGFQEATGDIPVDLGEVKAKYAQKLADQAEALKNVPAEYANPVRNVLNKLSGIEAGGVADPRALADFNAAVETYGLNPEQQAALRVKMGLPEAGGTAGVKMSTAQQLRSAYLDIARDYSGNVPKAVQRLAGEAARDIDAAMAKSADSVGATDQWRQANAKWKQLQETYNNPEHPLYKILQEPDSVKVPSRLLGKGNYGGSPNTIRQLQNAGIDLSPLKREVAQQIADKNFALTNGGRGLAGYSTEFLKTLYTPAEFQELTTIGRIGRAIKFEMNPSGTSNVMEGRHQLMGIIHGTVGATVGPIASRITTSQALRRAAMPGVDVAPRGLADILGTKPPELPPETPPEGGTPVTPSQGPTAPPAPKPSPMAAVPAKIADYSTWRNANFKKSPQGGWEDASGKIYTDERLHQLHEDAVAGFQRGIKPPQKRTFERQSEADVKQFFNYRFDQLRSELKDAKAAGDQAAIADVQRRMNELDEIQRQPRPLQDVLAGKPPKTAAEIGAEVAARSSENSPKQAAAYLDQAAQNLFGKPFAALTDAEKAKTYSAGAKLQDKARGAKPQSARAAVHEVLGEHAPTTPQQAMETGATVQGNYGNDTQVKTTTGNMPAKYKVVEADSLIPSHNAQTFAKNPQYPEGVQERAYHTSKEAQARVIQQAQNYDPAYTINTNPDAVNGPPVVTKDGIVLGGNSRTMSTQRLYKADAGDAYRADLVKNASQFGVSPEQIAKMKQPVLVREVETPANIEQARRIGADLNKNMTGAMGTGEKAVSAGRSVKPATLATISGMVNDMGEGATLRDAMRQHGKDFVSMMVKDGVIGERERPQFIDTATGGLNEEGKTFVERALMGSVVDDPRLMDRTPKSVLNKLEGSLGDLSAVGARTDEYNLMPIVREALQEHADMAMRGLDVDKYLAQSNMFGQGGNPAVQAMTRALAGKPKAFREAMRQFAEDAKFDKQGQGLLGILHEKPSAVKAFNDAFGTNLTEEQFHDALLQSYKKEGTIGANAGQETGNPKVGGGLRENPTPQTRPGSKRGTTKTGAGQQATNEANPVEQRSLADILGGKPQEKIDLNAPKNKRVIPPDVTAKADYSGQTVPAKAPTFFSKAEQVAEQKLPNSVKADQVISTLQNAGVKAEELKWLGLDDFLKGKDKVSKADLLEHIRQNNVQVKEVMKGGPAQSRVESANQRVLELARKEHIGQPDDWALSAAKGDLTPTQIELSSPEMQSAIKELRSAYLERNASGDRATKFQNYQLPGGENYRELLLTLPEKTLATPEIIPSPDHPGNFEVKGQSGIGYFSTRERALKAAGKYRDNPTTFRSSHFDEPNVLAHVRFNDRISPDGKKTLFIEEVQSDWHQKGRKQGYQGNPMQGNVVESPDGYRIEWPNGTRSSAYASREAAQASMADRAAENAKSGVPDAPFKSTWHELAMKRMLRYAAEKGYDRLAWTTGEQQAARYDLSKHVDGVEWNQKTGDFYASKNNNAVITKHGVTESDLADIIGKEAAQKLADKEPHANGNRILKGLELRVGGQGMKGFYDKILPDFMNRYGKKWGAKVGETSIRDHIAIVNKDGKEVWDGSRADLPKLDPGDKVIDDNKAHSIDIPPAMKHEVIFKGQPISKNQGPRSLSSILSGANA